VKRKGFNLIDTATLVKEEVEAFRATLPPELQRAVAARHVERPEPGRGLDGGPARRLGADRHRARDDRGARGARAALGASGGLRDPDLVPADFVLLAVMGITVSNIVMFGLILAVGMLVDGAIVVVEYADRRISEGQGPMRAYVEAAKRMFWPIVSSTATTLCAFLPMLFWPGVAGEFMGMLPVTLIFVLSASLIVALIFLPVMGGVAGR
jgi:multidrug efflux pump